MEQIILDGKKLATELELELKERVKKIMTQSTIQPVLATILVGTDPSSKIYVYDERECLQENRPWYKES